MSKGKSKALDMYGSTNNADQIGQAMVLSGIKSPRTLSEATGFAEQTISAYKMKEWEKGVLATKIDTKVNISQHDREHEQETFDQLLEDQSIIRKELADIGKISDHALEIIEKLKDHPDFEELPPNQILAAVNLWASSAKLRSSLIRDWKGLQEMIDRRSDIGLERRVKETYYKAKVKESMKEEKENSENVEEEKEVKNAFGVTIQDHDGTK
jgi:hypothetical protein